MDDERAHVVITGGEGDLAKAIASELHGQGHQVATPGRGQLDVRIAESIDRFFNDRVVDLLVCNAGVTRDAPIGRLTENDWDQVWRTNFRGALDCARAVIPGMEQRGGGQVVFISSFSAHHPPVGQAAYAASKAALNGLVSDLAVRHGSSNVRINAVLPGFLETRMTESVSAPRKAQVLCHHTLGRFNTCAGAARFIGFLHFQMPDTSGQVFQLDSRLASF